jgi:hypothetical protein
MLTRFYDIWRIARLLSLGVAGCVCLIGMAQGQAWNLEIEYIGPGSEAERLFEQRRDDDNREANDRFNEGSTDPNDAKGSADFQRDHGV